MFFFLARGILSLFFILYAIVLCVKEVVGGLLLRVVSPLVYFHQVEAGELLSGVVILKHTFESQCAAAGVEVVAVDDDAIAVVVVKLDASVSYAPVKLVCVASSAVVPVALFSPSAS